MESVRVRRPSPPPERLHPVAGCLCLFGVFVHMMLAGAVLFAMGFNYATFGSMDKSEGAFYEKIHPGTYFIYLAFLVMLCSRGNPLRQAYVVYRENRIAWLLLVFYLLLIVFMVGRSGPGGVAFIIDTHVTAVICGIVLHYTPGSLCKKAVNLFIMFAALNSLIGIVEAAGHFRVIPYRDIWPVLKEDYFRASALEGHPLENASFTALALFTALGMRYPVVVKAALTGIFVTSLVAFGGRAGLAVSVFSLAVWSIPQVIRMFRERRSLVQMLAVAAAVVAMPVLVVGGLFAAINSGMGERIAAHAQWDDSANTRWSVYQVVNLMTDDELVFGASANRLVDIAYRHGRATGAVGIENPWVMMFLQVGGLLYPFWLLLTAAFAGKLIGGKPLALKLVVLNYFLIASTSVSFGTKDSMYPIMVFAVVCASRALATAAARPMPEARTFTPHPAAGAA